MLDPVSKSSKNLILVDQTIPTNDTQYGVSNIRYLLIVRSTERRLKAEPTT